MKVFIIRKTDVVSSIRLQTIAAMQAPGKDVTTLACLDAVAGMILSSTSATSTNPGRDADFLCQ
jgi:heme O synthase-like polyprenyltransferase